jgi:predicted glycoside hydrolase/deacetylase ChbG (UPF0249 family)
MKYLIVNADDFGASRGINRGILEAHRYGILTSTSLLVNAPFSQEAAELAGSARALSVGLHFNLDIELSGWGAAFPEQISDAVGRQFACFAALMGQAPTHLDSHHNVHRDPRALPHLVELAARHGLPLREHSPVRYLPNFYGRWNGESHLEQISPQSLSRLLETEVGEGITELSCHPGYAEADYTGSYAFEREVELQSLCAPAVRRLLAARAIQLVGYHELNSLAASPAA